MIGSIKGTFLKNHATPQLLPNPTHIKNLKHPKIETSIQNKSDLHNYPLIIS